MNDDIADKVTDIIRYKANLLGRIWEEACWYRDQAIETNSLLEFEFHARIVLYYLELYHWAAKWLVK